MWSVLSVLGICPRIRGMEWFQRLRDAVNCRLSLSLVSLCRIFFFWLFWKLVWYSLDVSLFFGYGNVIYVLRHEVVEEIGVKGDLRTQRRLGDATLLGVFLRESNECTPCFLDLRIYL